MFAFVVGLMNPDLSANPKFWQNNFWISEKLLI